MGQKKTSLGQLDGAVVVAVVTMSVMQVAVDQVVDMIAVRHRFMTAVWAVLVRCIVSAAAVIGRTRCWVGCVDRQSMLVGMPVVGMMQVTIVQIVDMVTVLHGGMSAIGAVAVVVIFVGRAIVAVGHDSFLGCCITRRRARKVG